MLIEISELDFKLLIILIYPLFSIADKYTSKLYLVDDNFFYYLFINYFSYILSLIFIIISYYKRKSRVIGLESTNENKDINRELTTDSEMSSEIDKFTKKINKKKRIKGIIYLMILCAIGILSYLYTLFFEDSKYKLTKKSLGILFEIVFFVLLSFLFLKQKLYKHNFICLVSISVSLLIMFIISVFYMESQYILESILYYIGYTFVFSLYDVFGKKYMNDIYKTPYYMMFEIGIVISILLIIYDLFAYYLNKDIGGIITGFQNNITSAGNFFAFVLHIIVTFIWNLGIWLTIYNFTPCHYFISEYITEYIKYWTDKKKFPNDFYSTSNIIIISFLYFINFFFFLVFNEVIILNFWNLDYNTKKRIRERMIFDGENIKKEIPLININPEDVLDD